MAGTSFFLEKWKNEAKLLGRSDIDEIPPTEETG